MSKMLDTSREAYESIRNNLPDKQWQVLTTIRYRLRPMCNYEIAISLGWPVNCVTGRIKELREKGLVVDDGKRPGPPQGRTVYYWRAVKAETLF